MHFPHARRRTRLMRLPIYSITLKVRSYRDVIHAIDSLQSAGRISFRKTEVLFFITLFIPGRRSARMETRPALSPEYSCYPSVLRDVVGGGGGDFHFRYCVFSSIPLFDPLFVAALYERGRGTNCGNELARICISLSARARARSNFRRGVGSGRRQVERSTIVRRAARPRNLKS
jgi:hypothetical protein